MRTAAGVVLSVLLVTLAPAATQPIQIGGATTIDSDVLGEERLVFVRLPPDYEAGGDRFPVLYLTDGRAQFLHTVGTVEFLARAGLMPELIVVGITNTDRTRDLTPTRADMTAPDGQVFRLPTSGGADDFLSFIETELIPWVEGEFRTQPLRLFAGHSFGGLFAIHAMTTRPDLFDGIIAVSPSLRWDDDFPIRKVRELFKGRKALDTTLFVTLGEEGPEMQRGFEELQRVLRKSAPKGFRWGAEQWRDEDHGSVVLRSHYHGFRKIFEGWALPRDPATGLVVGGFDGARKHFRMLSELYGYEVAMPEVMVNRMGYGLLAREKYDDAIEVFTFNVETYPDSANVYDSLGEALEKSGRFEEARARYARAVDVGEKNGDQNLAVYRQNLDRVDKLVADDATAEGGDDEAEETGAGEAGDGPG